MAFLLLLIFYFFSGVPILMLGDKVFGEQRMIFRINLACILGFIYYTLFELCLAHFGLAITGFTDVLIKSGYLIICWTVLLIKHPLREILTYFKNSKYDLNDHFQIGGILIFSLFFIYIFKVINSSFFIPWDVFHYWLLDPKIIYETGKLRSGTDLIDMHKHYGSFLSVAICDFYEIIGSIKERYAAYFTVLHSIFATVLLWMVISSKKDNAIRLTGFVTILAVLFTFSESHWFYSCYTEVQCSFYVLFFSYLMVCSKARSANGYIARTIMMITILFVLLSVKPYWPQTMLLVGIWLTHDYFKYPEPLKSYISRKRAILIFGVIIFLAISNYYYHNIFIELSADVLSNSPKKGISNIGNLLQNLFEQLIPGSLEEFKQLYSTADDRIDRHLNYYTLISIVTLILLTLQRKSLRAASIMAILIGLFTLFLVYVIFFFADKENDSFYRYATIIFFTIPLLSIEIKDIDWKLFRYPLYLLLFIVTLHFIGSSFRYQNLSKENHTGEFSDYKVYERVEEVAKTTKSIIGNSRLLVVNAKKKIMIRTKSSLMIRYNLIGNIVGGIRFQTNNYNDFMKFIDQHEVDFVLIEKPESEIINNLICSPDNKSSEYLLVDLRNDNVNCIVIK